MEVTSPSTPNQINRGSRHTLFVEGKFDVDVLSTFFDTHRLAARLDIRSLGSCSNVRAAAEALHAHHPEYYFLIDRDHCPDDLVERSWRNFPDPATSNLLIWRRREFENYFLTPEYLVGSPHLAVSESTLRATIREACQRRLYLDAVNLVLTGLRDGFQRAWIKLFQKPDEFPSRDAALARLRALEILSLRRDEFTRAIATDALETELDRVLTELTGSRPQLDDDHGLWRQRLCGKEVLRVVIEKCFRVRTRARVLLDGYAREREVARALVQRPLAEQPDDLRALHGLLSTRLHPRTA